MALETAKNLDQVDTIEEKAEHTPDMDAINKQYETQKNTITTIKDNEQIYNSLEDSASKFNTTDHKLYLNLVDAKNNRYSAES